MQRLIKVLPTFIDIVEKEGKDIELGEKPGDLISAFQGMSMLNKEIATLDARLSAAGMGWNEFWPGLCENYVCLCGNPSGFT
ncbi:MAG: hypothetical protein ACUVQT_00120 [bacterium]